MRIAAFVTQTVSLKIEKEMDSVLLCLFSALEIMLTSILRKNVIKFLRRNPPPQNVIMKLTVASLVLK